MCFYGEILEFWVLRSWVLVFFTLSFHEFSWKCPNDKPGLTALPKVGPNPLSKVGLTYPIRHHIYTVVPQWVPLLFVATQRGLNFIWKEKRVWKFTNVWQKIRDMEAWQLKTGPQFNNNKICSMLLIFCLVLLMCQSLCWQWLTSFHLIFSYYFCTL